MEWSCSSFSKNRFNCYWQNADCKQSSYISMNIWCFLLTRISKILFDKRLAQAFAFKRRGRVIKTLVRWAFEALRENQKLGWEFEKFAQVFKKLVRVIKSLATCMRYNTAHGAPINHGKEYKNLVFSGRVMRYKDFVGNYFVHLSMSFKLISRMTKHLLLL